MTIEIKVPTLGQSVTEATVGQWFKKAGDAVKADEPLVELETDKVTVEVPAPASGVLASIVAETGTTIGIGALLGSLTEGAAGAAAAEAVACPGTCASDGPTSAAVS
jgi:2-oxoglutarate dehydrogenase E2 component (dihydrolipoamide succinyltransferase)